MLGKNVTGVVTSTTSRNVEYGTPKTVPSIIKVEQFLVTFYDTDGKERVDMLFNIGGSYFASPQGEKWCKDLRPVVPWLGATMAERVGAKGAKAVPTTDTVQVLEKG